MAALASVYERPEWKSYEGSPQFQDYLAAKSVWEMAHAKYANATAQERSLARQELIAAETEMKRLLEICRSTPEHLAATGWGGIPKPKAPRGVAAPVN